ncbi:GFA family protein [Brevundimonas nasdae]|uniref:GFA family protein n=1 Tax=Brevundimonas nasdae TaxID=172043 RepID=UPI003F6945BC
MDTASDASVAGRCLCGGVRFTATPQGGMHACHCEACRKISGGVSLSVDCGDSVVVEGEVASYASSEWAERQFCPTCGSGLFWRLRAGGMTMVSVQAFDDPGAFVFEDEVCIDRKPGNYAMAGDRPRITEAELMAMYAPSDA